AMDNYWVVRQRDAHAWAEVWLAGEGWVRVDPTGAVMPTRLGSLTRLAAPEGLLADTFRNLNPTLARQLRDAWEAINNRWNQWVLNYTQGRQLDLLRHLGFDSPSWRDLLLALALVVGTAGLAGALWMLWERQQHDPWLRLLDRARRQLEQQGLPAVTRPTPRELARQTQQHWGDTARARAIEAWLLRLEAQRYSAAPGASLATLRREFRQIPWTQTTKT
ncbi:MAG: protein-glutamine gamma-glutamyltransferase, partial [Betaproteobacteria bacterium]|nr:protein-glutamine gamma-glutamyltransferase [Betaproteobacteria bacterium]